MKELLFWLNSDNRLTTFPLEFCDMKHLDVLDLSMNKMTEVPAGVGKLQVVELNLNQNQVQRWPLHLYHH